MPAARSAFCHCARFDPLRSGAPGVAAQDTFHHVDARRKAGAVADPVRRQVSRSIAVEQDCSLTALGERRATGAAISLTNISVSALTPDRRPQRDRLGSAIDLV